MRSWYHVMILCLMLGTCLGALGQDLAPATPKSPAAQNAIKKFDSAEAKAKAEYDQVVAAARTVLLKELEAALQAATKAGNLDEALRIRDAITAAKPVPASQPTITKAPELFMPVAEVLGVWKEGNGTKLVLTRDGRFDYAGGFRRGTWKLTKDALIMTWEGMDRVDTFHIRDGAAIKGENTSGRNVNLTRGEKP